MALPTLSNTAPTLSSSAGHISGQFVNPKYTSDHFPSKSFSVKGSLVERVREKGPPTCGRPYCRILRSFSTMLSKQRRGSIKKSAHHAPPVIFVSRAESSNKAQRQSLRTLLQMQVSMSVHRLMMLLGCSEDLVTHPHSVTVLSKLGLPFEGLAKVSMSMTRRLSSTDICTASQGCERTLRKHECHTGVTRL